MYRVNFGQAATFSAGALLLASLQPQAIAQETEWEAGTGYHEEEWYDPSDWFDDEVGVNYGETWSAGYDTYDYYDPLRLRLHQHVRLQHLRLRHVRHL